MNNNRENLTKSQRKEASNNTKKFLVDICGETCAIKVLGLRTELENVCNKKPTDISNRKFKHESKRNKRKAKKKENQKLTIHHIKEAWIGGKLIPENCILLELDNHQWFNDQPKRLQKAMNSVFIEYKNCCVEARSANAVNIEKYLDARQTFSRIVNNQEKVAKCKEGKLKSRKSRDKYPLQFDYC